MSVAVCTWLSLRHKEEHIFMSSQMGCYLRTLTLTLTTLHHQHHLCDVNCLLGFLWKRELLLYLSIGLHTICKLQAAICKLRAVTTPPNTRITINMRSVSLSFSREQSTPIIETRERWCKASEILLMTQSSSIILTQSTQTVCALQNVWRAKFASSLAKSICFTASQPANQPTN